jgi:hypothetical protein
MKYAHTTGVLLIVAAMAIDAPAQAQGGKTREQVQKELAEAIRNGDIIEGESGLTQRERFPWQYTGTMAASGKSRAGRARTGAGALQGRRGRRQLGHHEP